MSDSTLTYFLWALTLGAVSAMSLPLGSLVGLNVRFRPQYIAAFAAFGAGALVAALSVELVAPNVAELAEAADTAAAAHARHNFFALIVGAVAGGLLFVALDNVVNQKGGYLRKTATTLAHMAKRRRKKTRKMMQGVLDTRPFSALPEHMTEVLAGMLTPEDVDPGKYVLDPGDEPSEACIVLDGEVDVEMQGRHAATFGPGTLCGMIALVVPDLPGVATFTAKGDVTCLKLKREDIEHLRAMSPVFDEACLEFVGERMEQLKYHVTSEMDNAVQWADTAAAALRLGHEAPELTVRRAHAEHEGSPLAVWLGILLDGIPESVVIGAGLFMSIAIHPDASSLGFMQVIPFTLIAGLFLSNFPEALSSSSNMLAQGLGRRWIFLMWFALMVMTAVGSGLGFLLAGVLSETWLVFAEGVAAGAMLTMIAAAMIPEAAAHGKPSTVGLCTLAGFLCAVAFKLFE